MRFLRWGVLLVILAGAFWLIVILAGPADGLQPQASIDYAAVVEVADVATVILAVFTIIVVARLTGRQDAAGGRLTAAASRDFVIGA